LKHSQQDTLSKKSFRKIDFNKILCNSTSSVEGENV